MINREFYKLLKEIFKDYTIDLTENRGIFNIFDSEYNFKIYCYSKKNNFKLEDKDIWYISVLELYEVRDIQIVVGYERQFLEHFRDNILKLLKDRNRIDNLLLIWINQKSNSEVFIKSIVREHNINSLIGH